MKRPVILVTAMMVTLATPPGASARTQANSFLDTPAPTHDALMRQVRTDPDVMDRYQRHFAMTPTQVLAFFDGLRLQRLKWDQTYDVYAVPRGGALKSTKRLLRKGTLVWVDERGKAVLMEVCGNPVTRGPAKPESANIVSSELALQPQEDLRPMLAGPVANEDLSDEMFAGSNGTEPTSLGLEFTTITSGPIPNTSPTLPGGSSATPTSTPAVDNTVNPLLNMASFLPSMLDLVSGGFAAGVSAGILSDGYRPRAVARPADPVDVVPEPAAILALSTGITLVATRRKRIADK